MRFTDLTDFTGYRNPTDDEYQKVYGYVTKMKKKENIMFSFWSFFAMLICIAALCTILTSDSGTDIKMIALEAVLALVTLLAFVGCRKNIKKNKVLCEHINDHKFEVMDCKAVEADPAGGNEGPGGSVRICNEAGQICDRHMLVDAKSCHEWKANPDIPFLLVKCNYGKHIYFEVFSERKFSLI